MIKQNNKTVDLKRRCELLDVARSTIYYQPKLSDNDEVVLLNEIRDIYQECPFYGYRRILVALRKRGDRNDRPHYYFL